MKKNLLLLIVVLVTAKSVQGQCKCGKEAKKICEYTEQALTFSVSEQPDTAHLTKLSNSLDTLLGNCEKLKFSRIFRPRLRKQNLVLQNELAKFSLEIKTFKRFYENSNKLLNTNTVCREEHGWDTTRLSIKIHPIPPRNFKGYMKETGVALDSAIRGLCNKIYGSLDSVTANFNYNLDCYLNRINNNAITLEQAEKFSDLYRGQLFFHQEVKRIRKKLNLDKCKVKDGNTQNGMPENKGSASFYQSRH